MLYETISHQFAVAFGVIWTGGINEYGFFAVRMEL